jgi:hypothetical protein
MHHHYDMTHDVQVDDDDMITMMDVNHVIGLKLFKTFDVQTMSHYVTASSEFVMCSVAVLGSLLLISSSVHTITSSTPSMQPRLVAFAFFALLLVASIGLYFVISSRFF